MHPVSGQCPVCGEEMIVTRLHCRTCDSVLEGHFGLGPLSRLTREQLSFVETFIRCEGKLNRAQEELSMSYPAVRSRLTKVIRALGYEVHGQEPALSTEERAEILEQLASGAISPEEAVALLEGES
jgi:hypothetical protein